MEQNEDPGVPTLDLVSGSTSHMALEAIAGNEAMSKATWHGFGELRD